jgi:nucleotide-binding universal stress UspA family protein
MFEAASLHPRGSASLSINSQRPMKILCATDFSQPAKDAAEVAAYIAAKLKVPLALIHCITDWLAPADYPVSGPLDLQAEDLLNAEADRICAPGQRVEIKVLHGSASHHITAVGNTDSAMIVMGATGKGTVGRLLVGSVAEHVAETVTAPTLIVRNAEPLLNWVLNGKPLKVLCASDIAESENALTRAISRLLVLGPLSLECAHVVQINALLLSASEWLMEQPTLADPTPEEVEAMRVRFKKKFQQAVGFEPQAVHVRQTPENPAYELVSIAQGQKADLIIVGSHHKHGLQRVKHPSFSRRVLAHAHTNVLCVHLGTADLEPKVLVSLKRNEVKSTSRAET